MPDYTLRRASRQDIKSIVDLCDEHAKFEDCYYDRTSKEEKLSSLLFRDQPRVKCLVVDTDAGVMGYSTYMPEFSTWDAAYYMHMDCLYLRPELRGQGIGREIIELILSEAKAAGYINLQWQTPSDNDNAIAFYTTKLNSIPKNKIRFYLEY